MAANIEFDESAGLKIPSTEEIREEVIKEWQQIFNNNLNTMPQSPQGQIIDSQTAHIATKNIEILKLSQQFNPLTAEGVWQDALGHIYFLKRKVAQSTRVVCFLLGLPGTYIPQNSKVSTSNDYLSSSSDKIFYLENGCTLDENGRGVATFISETTGPIEVKANEINKIISVLPGWDSVINNDEGIVGRNEESQQEFEGRRYLSVSKNAHGSAAAVYGALADLENVVDLAVIENRKNIVQEISGVRVNPHSLFISILGGNDKEIAQTIYQKLSAGCDTSGSLQIQHVAEEFSNAVYTYFITRPTPLSFEIQVKIRLTLLTPATIEEDLQKKIFENFYGLDETISSVSTHEAEKVRMASTVYSSRFYNTIINNGVEDLLSVKLRIKDTSEWFDEVFIPADKIPALAKEDVIIQIIEA